MGKAYSKISGKSGGAADELAVYGHMKLTSSFNSLEFMRCGIRHRSILGTRVC
jgi:hypothetical protein